jgi:Protein of unknown function (DUF1236)
VAVPSLIGRPILDAPFWLSSTPPAKVLGLNPSESAPPFLVRSIEDPHSGESMMRALFLFCVTLLAMGSSGYAQDQTLRGVFAPPGLPPSSLKSGKSTLATPDNGAVGSGPRVTISGEAFQGQTLPNDVIPTPLPDRPGYGTAVVNGRRAIIDLRNNRIFQILD